jgi:hypothetical protein
VLKARLPSAETSMSWTLFDGCKRILMIETVLWRLRFNPLISRYSALDLDNAERNFLSSGTFPIKADCGQVVIVTVAAVWRFARGFSY